MPPLAGELQCTCEAYRGKQAKERKRGHILLVGYGVIDFVARRSVEYRMHYSAEWSSAKRSKVRFVDANTCSFKSSGKGACAAAILLA
jgi:hypothetical protein